VICPVHAFEESSRWLHEELPNGGGWTAYFAYLGSLSGGGEDPTFGSSLDLLDLCFSEVESLLLLPTF
jgi:hypothetical protein